MSGTETLFIYYLTLEPHYQDQANWTEEATQIIQAHARFLDNLGKEGVLVFAGRTLFDPGDPDLFGIAVIKAESLEAAQTIMAGDPAVQQKIQRAVLHPFSMGIRHLQNLNNSS